MSQKHYIKKWQHTQQNLNRILRVERPVKTVPPDRTKTSAFNNVSMRYVKYIQIYQNLQKCYDYMVHPQKRILIGQCLEGVIGRLIELRYELIRLDLNPYSYLGAVCHDLKLTPHNLEMSLPKSVYLERVAALRKRTQALDYILASMNINEGSLSVDEDVYTVEEAVLCLQKNQRGYHGRLRSKVMRKRGRGRKGTKAPGMIPLDEVDVSGVLKISSLVRGHAARQRISDLRHEMDKSLNMLPAPVNAKIQVAEETVKSHRHKEATHNDDDFKADLIIKTENMMEAKGPAIAEDMKAEILQWILECRSITNEFPELPSVEDGGSQFLFKKMSLKQLEDEMDDLEFLQGHPPKPGDNKPKEKKKEKPKPQKKRKDVPEEFILKPSNFVEPTLVGCANEYSEKWFMKKEQHNPKQTHDHNLLMEDVKNNVETIVRLEVDELMRQELDRLQKAVDKQSPGKPRKVKNPKKKEKKPKKMKDMTPGVPMEELFKELVLEDIIKKVPDVHLNDYIGCHNLISPTDAESIECLPDLGDIRKMVFDLAVLPMSSTNVHKMAPLQKSLLMVGPQNSGKRMLVHAMCSELGATLFDLTAANLVDKFPGKKGPKTLINMVMKVGKEMEPSVIHIDNCDLMFTQNKKLTKEQKDLKPARIKNELHKALAFIKPEDRILLVGTSSYPFNADNKQWFHMFHQLIFIYPPCHSSRYQLWEHLITVFKGQMNDHFSISALTKVSQGYMAGNIRACVQEVLTERRRSKQHVYPLRCVEFVTRLSLYDPIFHTELQAFREWFTQTPLAKKKSHLEELKAEGTVTNYIGYL